MLIRAKRFKIIGFLVAIILLTLFLIGYKLSYKKDIEKIDKKTLNF